MSPSCPAIAVTPTAASSHHSRVSGATQPRIAGTPVINAPPAQKAAKISHDPSVRRTSRMVATAAPEIVAERQPTSTQRPNPQEAPENNATPQVAANSAPTVARSSLSPRKSAAQMAVKTGAV